MGFGIEVDVAEAQGALDRILGYIKGETFAAVMDAADEVQARTRGLLLARHHEPHTKTPSLPGTPPASISDTLAGSVLVREDGDNSALVGPTTDYGRVQELGGWMQGHPFMYWQEPAGVWHHSAGHPLPDRPYLKPAVESAVLDGSLERIFYDHWLVAIQEALG